MSVFDSIRKLLSKRQKPRVFLGTLAVVPRTDLKRHFDQWGMLKNEDLDTPLRKTLDEIFTLPPAQEVSNPLPTDLGLDVLIPSFQSGAVMDVELGPMAFPLFWRPKVTVVCRLFYLTSNKTKYVYSVTEKMPWGEFFGRQLSWQAVFTLRPIFGADDLNRLLYLACHSLLKKLKDAA